MSIRFSEAAVHDLKRLREFVGKKDQETAYEVAQRLLGSIRNLASTPRMGRIVDGFNDEVREFVFGRYIVRYQIHSDHLRILRVHHTKENRSRGHVRTPSLP